MAARGQGLRHGRSVSRRAARLDEVVGRHMAKLGHWPLIFRPSPWSRAPITVKTVYERKPDRCVFAGLGMRSPGQVPGPIRGRDCLRGAVW
jgi:hypothetical protein